MRRLLSLILVLLIAESSSAQTTEEWLKQKETSVRYLIEQIAALKGYAAVVGKGYAIVQEGLSLISDIREEDFGLHENYFVSLGRVSAFIRNSTAIRRIKSVESSIYKLGEGLEQYLVSPSLSAPERIFAARVLKTWIDGVEDKDREVAQLLAREVYQMKEDERFERLTRLCDQLQDDYRFLRTFSTNVISLDAARLHEQKSMKHQKALQGIK